MLKELTINLSNFFLSVSDAIDLASPLISSHQQRTAYIAWQISRLAKLPEEQIKQIYVAGLFHDIGALTPEDKIRLQNFEEKNLKIHCIRSEKLFNSIQLLKPAAKIVRFHHTSWNECRCSIDEPHVLESQILFISDLIERLIDRNQYILHQVDTIVSKILSASGDEIHPDIADMFITISKREDFWLDLVSPRLYSLLLHAGPLSTIKINIRVISSLSSFFSKIIDFKSSFTATHSAGVAASASIFSKMFALTETECLLIEIAGYLHDLGKLNIPNSILEKPGRLTKEEFDIMKQHTYHTYMILSSIEGLEQITEWAAFHHEKLDGSGYPFHVSAEKLSTGARIMAVADIFTALTEDRPYRKGMQKAEVIKILSNQPSKGLLDKRIVNLLLENYDEILRHMKERQAVSREYYEKDMGLISES